MKCGNCSSFDAQREWFFVADDLEGRVYFCSYECAHEFRQDYSCCEAQNCNAVYRTDSGSHPFEDVDGVGLLCQACYSLHTHCQECNAEIDLDDEDGLFYTSGRKCVLGTMCAACYRKEAEIHGYPRSWFMRHCNNSVYDR